MIPTDETLEPLAALEDQRVRALVVVATAIGRAQGLADVLESAAEVTRTTLGVSTVSISRWQHEDGVLRTLINVGDLAPDEERWPTSELYLLDEHPAMRRVLRRGEPHITGVADPAGESSERTLLEGWGKHWSAAVPIVVGRVTWGELYVTRTAALGAISASDVSFLQAVAAQVALGLGRAERVDQLVVAAYRDPLTGLANRRAFSERLDETLAGTTRVTLLLADVDRLKHLNDSRGHDAGDRALREVARALSVATPSDALAARIGGDEFCIVLDALPAEAATALIAEVTTRLAGSDGSLGLSWGMASTDDVPRRAHDLLIAADADQYRAKRRSRRALEQDGDAAAPAGVNASAQDRRRHRDAPGEPWDAVARLLNEGLALLDARHGTAPEERERAIVELAGRVLQSDVPTRWAADRGAAPRVALVIEPRWLGSWSPGVGDALTLLLREASRG